jgi:hypothetical protein
MRAATISVVVWTTTLIVAAQQPNTEQNPSMGQQSSTTAPKVQPDLIPQEKAMHPAPSASAQQKTQKNSVGKGTLTVKTAQPVDFWQEQVAFTGGNMVTTDSLYDPNVRILYGYREDDFKCANGQSAHGGILEALYAQGNQANKPTGSGRYAVGLDEGKCAAKKSGVSGCKFDANGNATQCGAAAVNSQNGELDIVAAEKLIKTET